MITKCIFYQKLQEETKAEFFGKRGWTLHTVLLYTKNEAEANLNITAFDHWSLDTKQDAWFTASSLYAVFNTMSNKPKYFQTMDHITTILK